MMKNILLLAICILLLISCNETEVKEENAVLFESGIISSEFPEFATTLNADQDLICFNRTLSDRSQMWIMYSQKEGGKWTTPDTFPFSEGKYIDVDPFLIADGSRLYFSSNRPTDTLSDEAGAFNTWYVNKEGDTWSAPINPGAPLNSDSTEIFISMSQSGNAYFVSERDGIRGIKVSRYENGAYQETERLEMKLHGEPLYASNPCIASDESFLIVAARDPKGNGTPDLFVSWNKEGQWSEMINLGEAVNSPYAEFAPGLTKDDQVLYFSSERPGIMPEQAEGVRPPGDIYHINIQPILAKMK